MCTDEVGKRGGKNPEGRERAGESEAKMDPTTGCE